MGARFRLKAGYSDPSLGAEAQVVLTAFKHYGMIVADNGSDWYFQGTEDASWDDPLIADLKKIPVSQFEAIDESSLMVDPNSGRAAVRVTAQSSPGAQAGRQPVSPSTPNPTSRPRLPAKAPNVTPRSPSPPLRGFWVPGAEPRGFFLRF
jgi:hypothetical protein